MTGSLKAIVAKLLIFAAFTLSVTGLLAAVIGNIQPFVDFYDVKAEFSDATGLLENDVVKIAGVTVGKIEGAEVVTEGGSARALVTLKVRSDIEVPENARAAIRFRNLLGQRMVLIERDPDEPQAPSLPKDGTALIPLSQTSPAFDLGIVFNNLRPVLNSLNPEDANLVTRATVKIFEGREQRMQTMIAQLADVAETLGDRGPLIADLVTELDEVVGDLVARDEELSAIIGSFDDLMATLATRSEELARAAGTLGSSSNDLADLVAKHREDLDRTIGQLRSLLEILAEQKDDLDATIATLPETTWALNRATTYGEWANLVGVCLEGACEPGFDSQGATVGGLGDIFDLATGGPR